MRVGFDQNYKRPSIHYAKSAYIICYAKSTSLLCTLGYSNHRDIIMEKKLLTSFNIDERDAVIEQLIITIYYNAKLFYYCPTTHI